MNDTPLERLRGILECLVYLSNQTDVSVNWNEVMVNMMALLADTLNMVANSNAGMQPIEMMNIEQIFPLKGAAE